ncbi:glycosyltransferase family 87 protein [uncultured Adlercreutzia sp.]|uniref:glycosyltransferase family 87 protein n=1 Tax=uncultured Adlercreutzia sp. TaxID=875803 RepID=UPI00260066DF|nr:glycosyltransferase family 87 protein [uncultured Adlercreutzia sp.]
MADLNEHVAYLSQEIGPRPAGTEEEQRAALYISEQLSAEPGLNCTMEDFQCNPDSSLPRGLCAGVAAVVTLLATIFSVLAVPAIVIGALCALLFAAEVFDKPVLSRMLNRGVSQNVVAKYLPVKSTTRASRRRKVIIVANYDSGKVRQGLSDPIIAALPIIYWAELAALVLMPVCLIIRLVLSPEGTGLVAMNALLGVLMVIAVLPAVSLILEKLASYNEGANCNAAGVAVLMDVAARVSAARNIPDEEAPVIHGEAAAVSAGLVPEGAELSYEIGNTDADLGGSMESAAERLAAAKAAVAALTGKPVAAAVEQPEAEAVETVEESAAEESAAPEAPAVAVEAAPVVVAASVAPKEPEIPDWFKQGQAQAKKPKKERPVQRSRYAVALERAEEEINAREESTRNAADELSERMRGMRASVQAASAAAGATPTGVIAGLENAIAADAAAAAEQAEVSEAPVPVAEVAVADAAAVEAPAAVVVPEAPVAADPDATIAAPVVPVPVVPAASAAAEPAVAVPAVPEVVPTDDPDVVLREGQRPLTGATGAAPAVSIPSPLDSVPTPAAPAEPAADRRLVIPSVGEVPTPTAAPAEASTQAPARRRRAITLPNIGISQELPRISMDERQQSAPLSEERPAHDGRVRDLSAVIPSVAAPAASSSESALLGALPSLSGTAPAEPGLSGSINLAGAFTSMGATGAAAPLGDELIGASEEADLYIEDADDSVYAEQTTETGAMAGPGYVEMPKSRFGRLFGKRRRKAHDEESTPQEWLDVEDEFDAREVGAARGGWESFREDDASYGQDYVDDATTAFDPTYSDGFDDDFPAPRSMPRRGRHFEGGMFSRDMAEEAMPELEEDELQPRETTSVFAEGLPADFVFESAPDVEKIEQFRSDRIDMEVWFVALGSELAGNGGMRAFMEAHEVELKGSIFIELEGLGDGELTLIEKEGTYLAKKASSRMKRLARKAGQAVGLKVADGTMEWRDSASAYALKHGQQSMHLAGMNGRKPAFFAQEDDVVENVDADQISLNSDFVMELLKHI